VRTGHGAFGFGKFCDQPFHLVLLERHVDLDGGVTGDGCSNADADFLDVYCLLFVGKLVEQFVKHALNLRSFDSGGSDLYRNAACAERLDFKSVGSQLVRNFGENGLLGGRELHNQRHQQALALDFFYGALLENPLKEHALVGDVLVDDPESFMINSKNERLPNLTQRF